MTDTRTLTTETEVQHIISTILAKEDDIGWLTKVEAGRNLYNSLLDPNELVISSIVAREVLKEDFLCFIFVSNKANLDKTAIEYNELIQIAEEKIEFQKNSIQRQFLAQLAGDAVSLNTDNIAHRSPMEAYTSNYSWYDNVPAEEIATAMLAEQYSEIKN